MLFIHFIESDFHVGLLPSQEEVFFVFKFHYSTSLLEMNSLTFVYLKMSFFILSSFLKDCQADRFFPFAHSFKVAILLFSDFVSDQQSAVSLISFLFFKNSYYLYFYLFGSGGSPLLLTGFLWLRQAGDTLHYSAWASHCSGFSCYGAWDVAVWALVVMAHGLCSCGLHAQLP